MDFEFTRDQQMLRESVRDFVKRYCTKERMRELDETGEFPHDLWDKMAELGYLGVAIDEEYGGTGGDIVSQIIVAEELARGMAGVTWAWGTTSCFGGKSVGLYGTDKQKQFFLPQICEGKLKFAFSITEPGGGTDILGAMTTFAREVDDGFIVNGTKIFTTAANVADYLLLVARTKKKEELIKKSDGITVFLVDARSPGIEKRFIPKLGMKAVHTCEVFYRDVKVPKENVLGEVHKGWSQLVSTLNNERIILAAVCCGVGQAVLEDAVEYARERKAFGKPIGQFQAIQHYIADIAMELEQARLLTYKAAWLQSLGRPCGLESAMAKVVASDMAVKAADLGIQILGGYGYTLDYDMQRYWRDIRILQIGPISNEMARNYIAMELGLPRSY